jgi:type II secretory pathway pseudopilin PulG
MKDAGKINATNRVFRPWVAMLLLSSLPESIQKARRSPNEGGTAFSLKSAICDPRSSLGFSLVEVTIALGIITLAILSSLGLLSIGLNMNRDTVARTTAASIAREVIADLQMVTDWNEDEPSASPRLGISPNLGGSTPVTLSVLPDGRFVNGSGPDSDAAYRVDVTFGEAVGARPPAAHVLVSWPAAVAGSDDWPAPGSSNFEAVASLSPQ